MLNTKRFLLIITILSSLSAFTNLFLSVALWNSFLFIRWDAARFLNHSIKPIRSLKLNFCYLTLERRCKILNLKDLHMPDSSYLEDWLTPDGLTVHMSFLKLSGTVPETLCGAEQSYLLGNTLYLFRNQHKAVTSKVSPLPCFPPFPASLSFVFLMPWVCISQIKLQHLGAPGWHSR